MTETTICRTRASCLTVCRCVRAKRLLFAPSVPSPQFTHRPPNAPQSWLRTPTYSHTFPASSYRLTLYYDYNWGRQYSSSAGAYDVHLYLSPPMLQLSFFEADVSSLLESWFLSPVAKEKNVPSSSALLSSCIFCSFCISSCLSLPRDSPSTASSVCSCSYCVRVWRRGKKTHSAKEWK